MLDAETSYTLRGEHYIAKAERPRKNCINTIRQHLKETGMSLEEAQSAILTEKIHYVLYSTVTEPMKYDIEADWTKDQVS